MRVLDAVQAEFVRHVGDLVLGVRFVRYDFERARLVVVLSNGWPVVAGFLEVAFENFHDAVGV